MKKIIGLVVFVVAVIGGYLIWQNCRKARVPTTRKSTAMLLLSAPAWRGM